MRKAVLYIAMSADGYIADLKGNVDWLNGDGSEPSHAGTYASFMQTIDTVLLGYSTYHQIVTELSPEAWVYSGMQSYVITHREVANREEITFTDTTPAELIKRLKQEEGKDIWICGGATIANQLIAEGLVDCYRIAVIPILLGDGIPLFHKREQQTPLKLIKTETYNGIVELVYENR